MKKGASGTSTRQGYIGLITEYVGHMIQSLFTVKIVE
jgi:hypothetical protein